ncbi:hypothetical protein QE152_g18123 [Popillia japonica]|uniref:Uncharacterized protein n=1 Tax=Popillia japonica TaxID=7064 RepID=A0AAW1KZW2_POPJA
MEASGFKVPGPLLLEANLAENWNKFKQKFNLYLEATGTKDATEAKKIAILLTAVGDDGLDIYNAFTYSSTEDKNKLETIIKKFEVQQKTRISLKR